jgi:hypothetical protein
VTNGGCATQSEHRITPAAMAYTSGEPRPGSPATHPGEGTRLAPPVAEDEELPEPIPFRPAQRPVEIGGTYDPAPPVIGATAPQSQPMIHRTLPSTVGVPPSPQRRYKPPVGEAMPRRQMPRIYDGHPILGYWYVPAAILVAVLVAFSVVWAAGKLFGDDGGEQQASNPTPSTSVVAGAGGDSTPATQATMAPGVTVTPGPSTGPGKFKGGDAVLVTGTEGECLNVRVQPGRENDAIVCVKDGVELRVTGGPETAGELTWWKVQTELGEGWAAEDYLVHKP